MVSVVGIIQRFFMVSVVGLFMASVVAGKICYGFRRWLFMVSVVVGKRFYGFPRWIFGGFCRRRRIQHFRMYRAIPRRWLFMVSVVEGKRLLMVSVVGFLMVSVVARNVFSWFPSLVFVLWFPAATGLRLALRWKPYKKKENKKHQDVSVTN